MERKPNPWLWPLAGLLGLCLAVGLSQSAARFEAACAGVRADTLRLHIRAAGDTIAQQTEKLRVRDAVLELTGTLYAGADSAAEAKAIAARSLPRVALEARQALRRAGNGEKVSVYLANEYFETKVYKEYTLPAGYYDALCVEIGGGAGRNWWCCLYPQICLAACGGYDQPEQQALVVGDYELRFRLAEWWQKLTGQGEAPEEATRSVVCEAG